MKLLAGLVIGIVLTLAWQAKAATELSSPNERPAAGDTYLEAKVARQHRTILRLRKKLGHRERQLYGLKRTLRHSTSITEAIQLAATVYGVSSATLWRKASCESHLWPYAHNPSGASGLFQFLGSTWRSTPFGGFSIWSPEAQALAAGWMHAHGRGGEWVCQ